MDLTTELVLLLEIMINPNYQIDAHGRSFNFKKKCIGFILLHINRVNFGSKTPATAGCIIFKLHIQHSAEICNIHKKTLIFEMKLLKSHSETAFKG